MISTPPLRRAEQVLRACVSSVDRGACIGDLSQYPREVRAHYACVCVCSGSQPQNIILTVH